jgi:DNA-binding CsgD family transcriptional regulator
MAIAAAADIIEDSLGGASVAHTGFEAVIVATALCTLYLIVCRARALENAYRASQTRLSAAAEEAATWKASAAHHIEGLSAAIDAQLETWNLTNAEKQVALLLLKGLGLKEIAFIRETSERTVCQQAQSVYQKAGLAGRIELAAFFLEDLLSPLEDKRSGEAASTSTPELPSRARSS